MKKNPQIRGWKSYFREKILLQVSNKFTTNKQEKYFTRLEKQTFIHFTEYKNKALTSNSNKASS